jgi:hypothetical protein
MNIQWNQVTWYSKLLAVVLFVATFIIAFNLGMLYEQTSMMTSVVAVPVTVQQTTPVGSATTTPVTTTTTTTTTTSGPMIRAITADDQNTTINLAKGAVFAVDMGGGLSWSVTFDPASAIVAVGTDGEYKAVGSGVVTLSATGAPICPKGQACPQFRRIVNVTLNIGY